MAGEDWGLTSKIGPVEIDWPRSLGYYGGVALAVAYELVPLPIGVFIGAIPLIKMLNQPTFPLPVRFVGQVLDGASKPVGGDSDATIELDTPEHPSPMASEAPHGATHRAARTHRGPGTATS